MPIPRSATAALLILLAAAGARAAARADASATEQVRRDVTALVQAGYRGDVDTMLTFTHPALIERLGGPDAARAAMEKVLREARTADVALQSFSLPGTPDFLDGHERRFAIVRTHSVIRGRDGHLLESLNFLLGVREPGAKRWAWLEGSMLDERTVHTIFPDFPAGYPFPEVYRRRLPHGSNRAPDPTAR